MFLYVKGGSRIYSLQADHLGSTSVTADETGTQNSTLMYKAWGETRASTGDAPTDYGYTGQRNESAIGLYFYNARWYDPALGRFTQPDTIVPDPGNPQDWDRFNLVPLCCAGIRILNLQALISVLDRLHILIFL